MLLDYFDKIHSSFRKLNKIESLFRFTIREMTNVIMPIYFKLIKINYRLNEEETIIVSLTTFPARIERVWLVLESLLRQKKLPSKIVLWLSQDQFPNREADLPRNLEFYRNRELIDIRFVDGDLRSHKKYYYAFREFPNDIIITVDDDLFYASTVIRDLMDLHAENPNVVCCLRAYEVLKVRNKGLASYREWKLLNTAFGPKSSLFHTSGGGTLYKKSFFSEEVLNEKVFKKICFYADDVWLNMMLQMSGTKSVRGAYYSHLLPIKNKSEKLSYQNVSGGGNDKQIQAIVDYYGLDENKLFC